MNHSTFPAHGWGAGNGTASAASESQRAPEARRPGGDERRRAAPAQTFVRETILDAS